MRGSPSILLDDSREENRCRQILYTVEEDNLRLVEMVVDECRTRRKTSVIASDIVYKEENGDGVYAIYNIGLIT